MHYLKHGLMFMSTPHCSYSFLQSRFCFANMLEMSTRVSLAKVLWKLSRKGSIEALLASTLTIFTCLNALLAGMGKNEKYLSEHCSLPEYLSSSCNCREVQARLVGPGRGVYSHRAVMGILLLCERTTEL